MAVRDTDDLRDGLNPSSILRPRRGSELSAPTPPKTRTTYISDDGDSKISTQKDERTSQSSDTQIVKVDTLSSTPLNTNTSYLKFIRNPYPNIIGENPLSNYTRENGMIKLTGKYPENFLQFNEYPLDNITQTVGSYDFIIQFMDGSLYTSELYYAELELEFGVGNPYRNLQTVATVKVDDTMLSNYHSLDKFSIGEQYAEMNMMNTIDTKLDIIKHIDWLSSTGSELRSVHGMGKYQHIQTENLGFTLQEQLDGISSDPNSPGQESTITTEIIDPLPPTVVEPTHVDIPPRPPRPPIIPIINIPGIGNIGGGKIICGELYRQGFLSEEVWAADQEFGKLLYKTNPRIMLGYTYWAREVVKYMKNNPTHTKHLYKIFRPWTEHMAYKMGVTDKPNLIGNITQKIGYAYSMIVYNYYQIKWKRFRFTI